MEEQKEKINVSETPLEDSASVKSAEPAQAEQESQKTQGTQNTEQEKPDSVEESSEKKETAEKDSSEKEPVKKNEQFFPTDSELETVHKLCDGATNLWYEKFDQRFGTRYLNSLSARVLSVAVLSTAEDLCRSAENGSDAAGAVLKGLYKTGLLTLASQIEEFYHPVFGYVHRYDSEEYDRDNDLSYKEQRTETNHASAWSLLRAFRWQVMQSVNKFYNRGLADLELKEFKSEKESDAKSKAKKKAGSRDRSKDKPKFRTPEDATFKGAASTQLIDLLYTLMKGYNKLLKINLGMMGPYYSESNRLLREQKRADNKDQTSAKKAKSQKPKGGKPYKGKKSSSKPSNKKSTEQPKKDQPKKDQPVTSSASPASSTPVSVQPAESSSNEKSQVNRQKPHPKKKAPRVKLIDKDGFEVVQRKQPKRNGRVSLKPSGDSKSQTAKL